MNPVTQKPSLSIKNLSFAFSKTAESPFFENTNLDFAPQAIHFIRGKNGAGKSTLFRILRGNLFGEEHCTGSIIVNGHAFDLSREEEQEMLSDHIRMVPQDFDTMLADQFPFIENLKLARLSKIPSPLKGLPEDYLIPPLVDRFNINYKTPVHLLSGGQRQILAILMALQQKTAVLMLDEPTAALDDKNGQMVMTFLNSLIETSKNLTILIICHDKELVEQYAHSSHYFEIEVLPQLPRKIVAKPLSTMAQPG